MVESMNDQSRSCGAASCGSEVAGAGGCEVSAEAKPLKKLLAVIRASIGIYALARLIGAVDVREYYVLGRLMYAVNGFCVIALFAWLAIGIANRKNWARVAFIVYGLMCLFYLFPCVFGLEQGGGNAWVPFLDMANLALTVYCAAMLFTKKVSVLFFKSANGKKQAWAFCGVFFVYLVFTVVGSWNHESSDEYRRDRAKAAEQGLAKAQYDCSSGDGVPKDMKNTMKVLSRQAWRWLLTKAYESPNLAAENRQIAKNTTLSSEAKAAKTFANNKTIATNNAKMTQGRPNPAAAKAKARAKKWQALQWLSILATAAGTVNAVRTADEYTLSQEDRDHLKELMLAHGK